MNQITPTITSVAARCTRSTYFTGLGVPRSLPDLQQSLGSGEAREYGTLHLRPRVGIPAEDQGIRALDVDELLRVGADWHAVLPAVDLRRLYAFSDVAFCLFEE